MKRSIYALFAGCYLLLNSLSLLQAANVNLFVGPEIYYVSRTREGGVTQTGTLYGVRLGYERLKRYKFYYAVEGLYSKGVLEGKNSEARLKSEFTNANVETRFGYTFQLKSFPYLALTPFFGLGYMWEYSQYRDPSPISASFDNQFPYVPFGCLVSMHLNESIKIGLKFTGRWLWDGKQKIKDQSYDSLEQCYEEHIQYRIELPIDYLFCWKSHELAVRCTPFYEYRHYGSSINFPYDFLDTKFKFYGANVELIYHF